MLSTRQTSTLAHRAALFGVTQQFVLRFTQTQSV